MLSLIILTISLFFYLKKINYLYNKNAPQEKIDKWKHL